MCADHARRCGRHCIHRQRALLPEAECCGGGPAAIWPGLSRGPAERWACAERQFLYPACCPSLAPSRILPRNLKWHAASQDWLVVHAHGACVPGRGAACISGPLRQDSVQGGLHIAVECIMPKMAWAAAGAVTYRLQADPRYKDLFRSAELESEGSAEGSRPLTATSSLVTSDLPASKTLARLQNHSSWLPACSCVPA
jgi:hypothetical protein